MLEGAFDNTFMPYDENVFFIHEIITRDGANIVYKNPEKKNSKAFPQSDDHIWIYTL